MADVKSNGAHSGEPPPATPLLPAAADVGPPKKPKRNKYALACSLLASMTSILLGYDTGVMSGASIYIKQDLKISDVQVEFLIGTINIYSVVGSAVAGRTSDLIGRRYTIVVAGCVFFVGALLMGFATNYAFLMVGRFVAGIGVGYALMIAPVYTAEVAPESIRGFLTSFPEVFINFGVLLGFVANYSFAKLPLTLGWRLMLGIGVVPSALLALGVLAMPESPRWLVMQGKLGEAKKVLEKTSDSMEESRRRLAGIKEAAGIPEDCQDDVVEVQKESGGGKGVWRELFLWPTPKVRHILLTGVGIHLFQQLSAIDAVVMYSPRIFSKAGIETDRDKLLASMGVGFSKTVFCLVATFLLDRVGRRVLLLTSVGGLIISMLGLATGLTIIDHTAEKLPWAIAWCIIMSLLCVAFFSIGLGPIPWVYCSEVFPLRLRAQGCAIGVAVNRAVSGSLLMSFISLYKAITIGGAFFMYSGVSVIAWVFFFTLMPETQGRTLEETESLFGTFFRWRSTMKELDGKKGGENNNGVADNGLP
nr:polyol transporter 5-like [Ipomoea batatas]